MKTFYLRISVLIILILLCFFQSQAQTPGLITKPANNGGQAVLDPNGDGYVSKNASGFLTPDDEGAAYSEIPYRFFPAMSNEVLGDLSTGTYGGHTDFAPSESSTNTGSPAAAYFDGKNFLYRMRLGGQSSASKGYSILIDTDGKFSDSSPNPGFEFEVVLASNFGVQIIKHSASGPQIIFNGSSDQYSQKSVAASRSGGDADYFYDFYVPLTAFQGEITSKTPLRMSAVTISSAQSGLSGTISDVGGLNFKEYGYDPIKAWTDIINAFPPTTLEDIRTGEFEKVTAVPPVVNDPIYTTNSSISGTSIEVPGSIIIVYLTRTVNGTTTTTKIGETTVNSDGTWILSNVAPGTLVINDIITATVSPPNKNTSGISNKVIVQKGMCTYVAPPIITGIYNDAGGIKGISGTTTFNGQQTIKIYHSSNNNVPLTEILFTPAAGTTSPYQWNLSFETKDKTVNSGLYTATITPKGNCESIKSNQVCYKSGLSGTLNSYVPAINQVTLKDGSVINTNGTTAYVPSQINTLSGTVSSFTNGLEIEVLVDGIIQSQIGAKAVSSSSPFNWSINISSLNLSSGDLITVRTKLASNDCSSILSSASNMLIVTPVTAAPVINAGPYCGLISYISGTSTATPGTVIEIYSNGLATGQKGTVTISGDWSIDLSTLPGGGITPGNQITARAKAVDKLLSPASNTVISSPEPTAPVTINTVTEGQNFVTGTAPASTGSTQYFVIVTVDGNVYPQVQTDGFGNWRVNNIDAFDVYPGASVTASYKASNFTCLSRPVKTKVVCKAPLKYNSGSNNVAICSGETVQITLPYSEPSVHYNIMNGSAQSGSSIVGTGGAITLTSSPLFSSTTLTVMGTKIDSGCTATMNGSTQVTVNPLPIDSGLAFTPTSINSNCPDTFTASLSGSHSAYFYQLITEDGILVGSKVPGKNGETIVLSTGYVTSTKTFRVQITDSKTDCKVIVQNPTFTVVINGPSLIQKVTPQFQSVCANSTASVVVSASESGYTYQLKRSSDHVSFSQVVLGTGSQLTIMSYPLTVVGKANYYIAVKKPVSNCANDFRLNDEVAIEVVGEAVSTASASSNNLCGENLTITLDGNTPARGGTGVWKLSGTQHTTGDNVVIASPNSPSTTVSGLSSGTYTFTWTVTSSCGSSTTSSTSSVKVTVNCPAYYDTKPSKYTHQYAAEEVLATPYDQDNGVVSARIVSGNMLPPGTVINPTTGIISVENPDALVPGKYTFQVDLLDGNGGFTRLPVTIRFNSNGALPSPMPVDLLSFTATLDKGKSFLEWTTTSVLGNVQFDIERSLDGKIFEKIGSIKEGASSNLMQRYSFKDPKLLQGLTYYRLFQTDTEGKYSYSKVISLNTKDVIEPRVHFQAFPNPFTKELNVSLRAKEAGEATVQLINMQGNVVFKQKVQLTTGNNELLISPETLSEGIYIIKVVGANLNVTSKVVRSR